MGCFYYLVFVLLLLCKCKSYSGYIIYNNKRIGRCWFVMFRIVKRHWQGGAWLFGGAEAQQSYSHNMSPYYTSTSSCSSCCYNSMTFLWSNNKGLHLHTLTTPTPRFNLRGCLRKAPRHSHPHSLAPPPQNLQLLRVRDLETTANQQQGHRGSPLGFPHHPLPDKIVVAVDVDEGIFFFFSFLFLFLFLLLYNIY